MPKINELKDNLDDIQGNVIRGYRPFFGHYRFYHLKNQESGRAWLQEFLKKRPVGDPLKNLKITNSKFWSNGERPSFTVNIAFSHRGLEQLGLPEKVLKSFPEEFREGMQKRAVTILGDEPKGSSEKEKNIPKHWEDLFLQQGDEKTIHALVIVTGKTEAQKNEGVECLKTLEQTSPGVSVLGSIEGKRRPKPHDRKEHFGFTDGISQPFIEGSEAVFDGKGAAPGQGTPDRTDGVWRDLKPGEFILGYEDEFGEVAESPTHYDLRKNGTYLVLRKLQQNVKAFENFCLKASQELWPSDFNNNPEHYTSLTKAKFMGRWQSGCPVTLSPDADDETLANDREKNNRFLFNREFVFPNSNGTEETIEDKDGARCPLGAHIRRTNPRDHMLLAPKDIFDTGNSYDYHLNRHRIIRRGLTYGNEYKSATNDDDNRGVIFMALNASISRQFEFIQQHWVNNGEHVGQDKTNRDPILGKRDDGKAKMTVQGAENPFVYDLAQFVVEKGGEYFFYPGLGALQKLADRAFTERSSFLSDYEALESMSHAFRGNVARQQMVGRKWLTHLAQEMFKELHNSNKKEHKVFQVPGIPPPQTLPDLRKPPMVIATKYPDVLKILKNLPQSFSSIPPFSVYLYKMKMEPPRGPFVLGLEYFMGKYVKEIQILREVVYPSRNVGQTIYDTVERLANEEMNKHRGKGKIDVINDLVWPVALRLNGEYFGVPGPGPGDKLETFKRWSRDIYTDLFLNLRNDRNWTRLANKAVEEMNAYLTDLIAAKRKELKAFPNMPETVLTRMIKMQEKAEESPEESDGFEDKWDGVRRNMFGMVIGVVETTLKAVPRTIDQLLNTDRKTELEKTREAALEYKYKHDPKHFKKYLWEAMRFNPQNHVLFRLAINDFKLGEGTWWETETIKASEKSHVLMFAANLSAMFDPDTVFEPETFSIDRPDEHYIFFGHGPHECLGKQISEIQIPLLVKNIVSLDGLKRAKDPQFDPRDLRPKHLFLEFKAQTGPL